MRHTLPVILLLVTQTTYIEPAIVRVLPNDLSQYLPGGFQLTFIKDATAVGDMSAPPTVELLMAWAVGLSIIITAATKMGDLRVQAGCALPPLRSSPAAPKHHRRPPLSQYCDEAQRHRLIKSPEPHRLTWGVAFGANCVATAAQEACQIVGFFTIIREALGRPDQPEHLRSDMNHVTQWGAPGNVTAFRTWLTKVSTAEQAVSFTMTNCTEMDWKSFMESTRFADLTPTLPQRIHRGGWHTGRAENPVLTPLVTSESVLGQELVAPDTHPTPHPIP